MASLDPPCAQPLNIRINLNTAELAHLEDKLRSEYGPFVVSPERAEELKEILALADKDIEDHDSEVARLQAIQANRQRLEIQRAKLRSLLSPMRKLSNEILLHIFQYACKENILQSYPWLSEQQPWTKLRSPVITYLPTMAISSVCSRWRTLALSSPSLWANLTVETHTATLDQSKILLGFIDTVARYLERSGDWPLKIALEIGGTPGPHHETEIPSLNYLTQHACRWETFSYWGTYSLENYEILSGLHFPLLTELCIFSVLDWEQTPDLDRFEYAPKLCALTTTELATSKAPYHQLRHLDLQYRNLELAEILHRCPSVESLGFKNYEEEEEEDHTPDHGAHYTWRNITSLTFRTDDDDDVSYVERVFSSFDLPSLDVIVLDGCWRGAWPTETFISFISRSSCMITTFTLHSISLSDSDFIAALRVMPSLLHLEIKDHKWDDEHVQTQRSSITSRLISSLIQCESTSVCLVPKLHTLHLVSKLDTGAFDDSSFLSMIESRWFRPGSDLCATMFAMGRHCIRSVVLKFGWREVDPEVYKPLRILDKEGLRVVVSGTNGIQV
ncbi:hypothetical protein BDP27DRAFT_1333240 [Rhodocollybia butyracea]|uniref:F-box domain-containing protein n=1 Tax=Rhodocollybia butyracea TaxID=206335 RepID=A0A9P5PK14_9AGAR|nr:hypothetical protein BDP27DRAFT_1333240 [Rhodocollybia butyracea]